MREAELLQKIGESDARARSIAMTPRRELVEPNAPLSMRWQCELLGGIGRACTTNLSSRMASTRIDASDGRATSEASIFRHMMTQKRRGRPSTASVCSVSDGAREHCAQAEHKQASAGTHGIPLSTEESDGFSDQSGVGRRIHPDARGFVYLVAVRFMALSNTLETTFCVEAVELWHAVAQRYCSPQFTSDCLQDQHGAGQHLRGAALALTRRSTCTPTTACRWLASIACYLISSIRTSARTKR